MIRIAILDDLDHCMQVIESARQNLAKMGLNQWNLSDGYPTKKDIKQDILKQQLFVYEENNEIHGIAALIKELDPNYEINNFWDNTSLYISIHRLAVKTPNKGIASKLLDYSSIYAKSINRTEVRIDTHKDNIKMVNLINKLNFTYQGVITLLNSPKDNLRNAYYKKVI